MNVVKSKEFWIGAAAGVVIVKFVVPMVLPKVAPAAAAKLS